MILAGPGCQQQEQARLGNGKDLMSFARAEFAQKPDTASYALPRSGADLDFAVDDQEPCALVHDVFGQPLTGVQIEHDDPGGVVGRENLGQAGLEIQRPELPAIYSRSLLELTLSLNPPTHHTDPSGSITRMTS